MADYQEFLDGIDRKAYHEGEWQWEEDGYTVTRTYHYSPPGCHTSCGILLYVKDGKVERVEGDPLDPCTNGKLCIKCLTLDESVNHPDRLKYPMKRAGERGENKWERITWDEAYDEIEEQGEGHLGRRDGGNVHHLRAWHRPQHQLAGAVLRPGRASTDPEHLAPSASTRASPATCRASAAPSAHCFMGDFPIVDACSKRTLETRYDNPEWVSARGAWWSWGNDASRLQRRRLHRPLAGRQCVQDGGTKMHRPSTHACTWLGRRSAEVLAAHPSRHRRCAWSCAVAERHHRRGPVRRTTSWRPGATGFDELAELRARSTTPEWAAEICRPRRRRHPRLRAPVRQRQAGRHPVGPRVRPAAFRHGAVPCRVRPHGHLRQRGRAGRQHPRAQRVRDQRGLRYRAST